MKPEQALAYVQATAVMLSLPLDAERAERVAGHLVLSASLASTLDAYRLPADVEPAEVYCPAPFPAATGGRRA